MTGKFYGPNYYPHEKFRLHNEYETRFYDRRAEGLTYLVRGWRDIPGLNDHWRNIVGEFIDNQAIYRELQGRIEKLVENESLSEL